MRRVLEQAPQTHQPSVASEASLANSPGEFLLGVVGGVRPFLAPGSAPDGFRPERVKER